MAKPRKRERSASKAPSKKKAINWQRIVVLPIAAKEGYDELTPGQYLHVKDQVKQLVGFGARRFEFCA